MLVGTEWLVEASGCSAERLSDRKVLEALMQRAIVELDLCVVGEPLWHTFGGPGGVTGMYLLSESHLTCHTYPEFRAATFNLHCCRPRGAWPWEERLAEALLAESVRVRVMDREVRTDRES